MSQGGENSRASGLITPDEAEAIEPRLASLSSAPLGWSGIRVEVHNQLTPVEAYSPGNTHHLLAIALTRFDRLEFRRKGFVHNGGAREGDSLLVAAKTPCKWHWYEGGVIRLYVEPEALIRNLDAFVEDNPDRVEVISNTGARDPLIGAIGFALRDELESSVPGGRLYAESLGAALTSHLLRKYSAFPTNLIEERKGLSRSNLRQTLEYIHENLSADVGLDSLAAVVQMSPYHFARLFKRSTGLSPHVYVLELKIRKARELLRNPHLSVAEIGYELGFSSQSHFTAVLRRIVGTTPTRYRLS